MRLASRKKSWEAMRHSPICYEPKASRLSTSLERTDPSPPSPRQIVLCEHCRTRKTKQFPRWPTHGYQLKARLSKRALSAFMTCLPGGLWPFIFTTVERTPGDGRGETLPTFKISIEGQLYAEELERLKDFCSRSLTKHRVSAEYLIGLLDNLMLSSDLDKEQTRILASHLSSMASRLLRNIQQSEELESS